VVSNASGAFNTSNNRYTPQVAGKYFISATCYVGIAATGYQLVSIRKNGSEIMRGTQTQTATALASVVSGVVELNGTTDYIEIGVYTDSTGTRTGGSNAGYLYWMTANLMPGTAQGPQGPVGPAGDDAPTNYPRTDVSTDKTFALADHATMQRHTSATPHAWTIPPNSSVAFAIGDSITLVVPQGQGAITITRGSGVALYLAGATNTNANRTLSGVGLATLLKIDTDTWIVSGLGLT
jgi:hypothetical protein